MKEDENSINDENENMPVNIQQEERPLNFEDDEQPLNFEDEEFIDDKKEDELYNTITKDGSSVDPADDAKQHRRPENGEPIEIDE